MERERTATETWDKRAATYAYVTSLTLVPTIA